MISAAQKDDTLLNDIDATAHGPDAVHAWWLGQSGFLLRLAGELLLFDPYLSDSLTEKYRGTDTEHIRMSEIPVEPGALTDVRLVTSTHNHTDHLDTDTLLPLRGSNPDLEMLIPEANRSFVADRLDCDPAWPVGLNAGEQTEIGSWTVHAVPAAHDLVDRDPKGRCKYLGYVVEGNGWTVYHSGDTRLYPGIKNALTPFSIDLAFLPINGYRPERGVPGNLWGDEAANLASACDVTYVAPCHYDMFTFNTESPELFEETCDTLNQSYHVFEAGQRLTLRRTEDGTLSATTHPGAEKKAG